MVSVTLNEAVDESSGVHARVTLLTKKYVPGMAEDPDKGRAEACTLAEVLEREWPSDAHFTAYAPRTLPTDDGRRVVVRLNKDANTDDDGTERPAVFDVYEYLDAPIEMVALVGDCDDPVSHAKEEPARDEWRAEQIPRLEALGLPYYQTNGGYRVIGVMPAGMFTIENRADDAAWTDFYLGWCEGVERATGLVLDRACKDWTRCYRAPNVEREGKGPQRASVIGTLAPYNPFEAGHYVEAPRGAQTTSAARERGNVAADRMARAEIAVENMPASIQGHGGDRAIFDAVNEAAKYLGPDAEAIKDVISRKFNPRCKPPWGDADLDYEAKRAAKRRGDYERDPMTKAQARRDAAKSDGAPRASAGRFSGDAPDAMGCDAAVDLVIAQLAHPTVNVYQRSGKLVTVTREACDDGNVVRPIGAPTIRELVPPRLREIIRTTVAHDQVKLVGEVLARGEWSHIRPLDAIVTYPVMRRDGTLLLSSGYDAPTRTLAEIAIDVDVPDEPTQDDARAALATLRDLVSDFPFVNDAARDAWIAMLLTLPARPAIDGPTPLGLFEASQRGSGKTLLADLASEITTGHEAPRRVAPKTREEWDKTILSILLSGDPLVLIDNVTNMLVSDALDAVLTGKTYTQRLLGVSEDRRVAVRTVFMASANNARLSTDLVRRSLGCRLEPKEEDPSQRTGFRHVDIQAHARRERARYLGAVLTILRAYAVAERPTVKARPMGSYHAWCRVVRDALVWAGGTDPAATQDALRESADVERDELRELLTAWHAAVGESAVTVRGLLDAATTYAPGAGHEPKRALHDALRALVPGDAPLSTSSLGNALRRFRGQKAGGLALCDGDLDRNKSRTYRVISQG